MNSLPNVIHYCSFGRPTPSSAKEVIQTWRTTNPSFIIKEWNEENFDIESHPFTQSMYKARHFAFVADYVRLFALYHEGGMYLDDDMELVRDISPLLSYSLVLGEETPGVISAGMIGASKGNPFIQEALAYYDNHAHERITIPRVLTSVFKKHQHIDQSATQSTTLVLPPVAFYPYTAENISRYKKEPLPEGVYGVHLWNYSWGHPLNKFFKRIGVYSVGKKLVETLGVKKLLKKLLGFV
ncbi:MAG: hypothetical protein RI935_606 [Candidatus Parcubacteria bacterium]|jgi:hypothetical protein